MRSLHWATEVDQSLASTLRSRRQVQPNANREMSEEDHRRAEPTAVGCVERCVCMTCTGTSCSGDWRWNPP
ncbi:hypothetical protein PAHAL_9G039700 [Panicum hallii]|uniref:Uncharacterized protein n=1 Tax=Panicum hallii TaxID=206008 RepID=A0A2T8I013_9POAL|nr:hypothetical protein PAHAL_9G039700 [Panicum hallii]